MYKRSRLSTAVLAAAALLGSGAQAAPKAKAAAAPRITGMWLLSADDFARRERPPLTPSAAAAAAASQKAIEEGGKVLSDEGKKCLPVGMPVMMANEFALEFLETPGRVTIVSENSSLVRSVYLNRKTHTADLMPLWNGHSIGHWEGETLVIDTIGFNDRISHIAHGAPPSAKTHIVERFHLEDHGKTLIGETTFEDPDVLLRPWTVKHTYSRLPADAELWEYACEVDAPGWSERFEGDPQAKAPKS